MKLLNRKNIVQVLSALCLIPHIGSVDVFIAIIVALAIIWRSLHTYYDRNLPGRTLHTVIVVSAMALAILIHGRPVGIIPASAVLCVALTSLILRETQGKDVILIFCISGILLICSVVLEQNLFTTVHLCLSFLFMIQFIRIYSNSTNHLKLVDKGFVKKIFIILPVVILLFLVIPRATRSFIPPILRNTAKTGFSENLDPGSVANLIQTDKLAFRARFLSDDKIDTQNLYWRGKTLSIDNGMSWEAGFIPQDAEENRDNTPPLISSEIILENEYRTWLFALDKPVTLSFSDIRWQNYLEMNSDYTFSLKKDLTERVIYQTSSVVNSKDFLDDERKQYYLKTRQENDEPLLKLVEDLTPKTKRQGFEQNFATNLGRFLYENDFLYSLNPGAMPKKSVSDFIFNFKKGFCEHYAAASAHIFRLAGIPSRVVLGFQGGEKNKFDDFLSVRGRDAHAWTEYYSESKHRWMLFDATSYVAPSRLEQGGQQFHQSSSSSFVQSIDMLPDAMKKAWLGAENFANALSTKFNLFMLTFDFSYQKNLLTKLNVNVSRLGLALATLIALIIISLIAYFYLKYSKIHVSPEIILLDSTIKKLRKCGVLVSEFDSPTKIRNEMQRQFGDENETVIFMDHFINYRYAMHAKLQFKELKKIYKNQKFKA